ncbi:MAG: glutamine amidotransferase [Lentimonas sp.]|jgi:glutamine amidotransferase
MQSKIVIIDYGSGNLQSVFNALIQIKERFEADLTNTSFIQIEISNKPSDLKSATHIILPGVGSFGDCMLGLQSIPGMIDELKVQVLEKKKSFLGICVGMQLLADFGFEFGRNEGLGFIPGQVVKIEANHHSLKIPHTGWNNIKIRKNHPILEGIKDGEHFYFVHSFHFNTQGDENVVATFDYGQEINAIIAKNNIVATQFHPEKSSESGLKILQNFIN